PTGDEATELKEPREQPLDVPTVSVSAQESTIDGSSAAGPILTAPHGSNHLDALLAKLLFQRSAVVGPVGDESLRKIFDEARLERLLNQFHLVSRSIRDRYGDRKTRSVCDCHDLGGASATSSANAASFFFAPA